MSVDTQRAFSSPRLVKLFNEWMRQFTEEPEKYAAQFRTVGKFLQEQAAGKEPSYGETCAAYLAELEDEMESGSVPVVDQTLATTFRIAVGDTDIGATTKWRKPKQNKPAKKSPKRKR